MDSLVRLKYMEPHNQEQILSRKMLRLQPSLEDIMKMLDGYVEGILPDEDGSEGVILAYCFGNIKRYSCFKSEKDNTITPFVFPVYGKVEYIIKKGEFWVFHGDPIVLYEGWEDTKSLRNAICLFYKNPFENRESYKHVGYWVFQDWKDEEDDLDSE